MASFWKAVMYAWGQFYSPFVQSKTTDKPKCVLYIKLLFKLSKLKFPLHVQFKSIFLDVHMHVSLPFSGVNSTALTYGRDKRKSLYTPEQYGRKQLGLQSSFFMNWIWPLSLRQKKFLSPRTKTEDADWLKDIIHISRACSPIFRVQSTCKGKPKINLVAKNK